MSFEMREWIIACTTIICIAILTLGFFLQNINIDISIHIDDKDKSWLIENIKEYKGEILNNSWRIILLNESSINITSCEEYE